MLFTRENILGTIEAKTQEEVFEKLADRAVSLGIAHDAKAIMRDYKEREGEASTGFGGGVAIPHSKTDDVSEPTVLFARLSQPVEWNSIDDKPVKTVISILVPSGAHSEHFRLLSLLSRKLVHPEFVEILNNGTDDEVFEAIDGVLSSNVS
jgi:fructose-specific phosphotransferase system IIA component